MIDIFLTKLGKFLPFFVFFVTIFVFIFAIFDLFYARIPFWYDPGRDLLLGLENLKHITLIGQPTGIPGIFYGPYWVWGISLAQIISKNPVVISFIILTIPYFTIFPIILYKFRKIFDKDSVSLIWLLFILSFGNYFTAIWNPHLLPLFFLGFVYCLIAFSFENSSFKNFIKLGVAGFVLGIAINYSMSFGIGITFGTFIYFLIKIILEIKENKMSIKNIILLLLKVYLIFIFGFIIALFPFLFFEARHGFHQIETYINTLTASINHVHVVSQVGMSQQAIILYFLKIPTTFLHINFILIYILIFAVIIFSYFNKNLFKRKWNKKEIDLCLLLGVLTASILLTYLFSKNPVWEYHFIGFEIIFLLVLGVIMKHFPLVKIGALVIISFLFIQSLFSFMNNLKTRNLITDSLRAKELVVEDIYSDNGNSKLSVFAYNPAIYTFDYDYLLKYFNSEKHFIMPDPSINDKENIYLIFPSGDQKDVVGFTNYKTPNKSYKTVKQWNSSDGTLIIKRRAR